jgi:ubiquinone biosynthesis protein Coq4
VKWERMWAEPLEEIRNRYAIPVTSWKPPA